MALARFAHLRCKFVEPEVHSLNDPIRLPCCQLLLCRGCIVAAGNRCVACNVDHNGANHETAVEIMHEINANADAIENEIFEIRRILTQVRTNADNSRARINHLQGQLIEKLVTTIRPRAVDELNRLTVEFEQKRQEYQNFANTVRHQLPREQNRELTDDDLNRLVNDIYTCQDNIENVRRMEENCQKILHKVTFQPSPWTPDISCLGPVNI